MEKHKDAIKQLRTSIKDLADNGRKTKAEIRALKYDPDGKRRPETGPERHQKKVDYDYYVRPKARAALLAYGLLRGMPYPVMESKCKEPPSVFGVHKAIQEALGDAEETKAEWTLDRVQKLLSDASEAKEAA